MGVHSCVWRPEGDTGCVLPLLFALISRARSVDEPITPKSTYHLARQLVVDIPLSLPSTGNMGALPCLLDTHSQVEDANSRPHTCLARTLASEPSLFHSATANALLLIQSEVDLKAQCNIML